MIEQEKDVMLTTQPCGGEQFYNNDEVTLVLYLGFKQTNKKTKNTLAIRSLVPGKTKAVLRLIDE